MRDAYHFNEVVIFGLRSRGGSGGRRLVSRGLASSVSVCVLLLQASADGEPLHETCPELEHTLFTLDAGFLCRVLLGLPISLCCVRQRAKIDDGRDAAHLK